MNPNDEKIERLVGFLAPSLQLLEVVTSQYTAVHSCHINGLFTGHGLLELGRGLLVHLIDYFKEKIPIKEKIVFSL